jgi:hypothetical protein
VSTARVPAESDSHPVGARNSLTNALGFTDFQWGTFHLDERVGLSSACRNIRLYGYLEGTSPKYQTVEQNILLAGLA